MEEQESPPEPTPAAHEGIFSATPRGVTVWLTGLPCAGKSTIARAVAELAPFPVTELDGDEVRPWLSTGLGFSRRDRDLNVSRVGRVAELLTAAGAVTLVSVVSPFALTRDGVRRRISNVGAFLEVHVSCPLDECERRDVKGMYAKARLGAIEGFTGVDAPYEPPEAPELVLETNRLSIDECARTVLRAIEIARRS